MALDDGILGNPEDGAREDSFVAPTPQVSYTSSTNPFGRALCMEGGEGGSLHLGGEWGTVWVRRCPPRPRQNNYGVHCRAWNGQGGVSERSHKDCGTLAVGRERVVRGWTIVLDLLCVRATAAERGTERHAVGGEEGISVSCEDCGLSALVQEATLSVGKCRKGAERGALSRKRVRPLRVE